MQIDVKSNEPEKVLEKELEKEEEVSAMGTGVAYFRAFFSFLTAVSGYYVLINWFSIGQKYIAAISFVHLAGCALLWLHKGNKIKMISPKYILCAALNIMPVHDLLVYRADPTVANHIAMSATALTESLVENLPQLYIQTYALMNLKEINVHEKFPACRDEHCADFKNDPWCEITPIHECFMFMTKGHDTCSHVESDALECCGDCYLTKWKEGPNEDDVTLNVCSIALAFLSFVWSLCDPNTTIFPKGCLRKFMGQFSTFFFYFFDGVVQLLINFIIIAFTMIEVVNPMGRMGVNMGIFGIRFAFNLLVLNLCRLCGRWADRKWYSVKFVGTSLIGICTGAVFNDEDQPWWLYPVTFVTWAGGVVASIILLEPETEAPLAPFLVEQGFDGQLTYFDPEAAAMLTLVLLPMLMVAWAFTKIPFCKGKRKHFLSKTEDVAEGKLGGK